MYACDKREDSIAIRGVGDKSPREVGDIFHKICEFSTVSNIQLTELSKLAPSVWAANIEDNSLRLQLLSGTDRLRHSDEFKTFFVQTKSEVQTTPITNSKRVAAKQSVNWRQYNSSQSKCV